MFNFLLKHAVDNVWCNNNQDNQLIFSAHRISNPVGVLNYIQLMNRLIPLPVLNERYHVYQIGQVNPKLLGLLSNTIDWAQEEWINFKDTINNSKLYMDLYTTTGIEIFRYKSYYMYTNEKNLIFAIEEKFDQIYLRLYSNAYYESIRADQVNDYLKCNGGHMYLNTDIMAMQAEVSYYKSIPGYVFCYKNGYLIDDINLLTVSVGDDVEYVYDSSIKRIVTFTINDLPSFTSELDSKNKYLLHYESPYNTTIDYQDDIDIHILSLDTNGHYKGLYYHRNAIDSHRMVTHRDYSVVADYVIYTANELNNLLYQGTADINQFKIQIKIRKSGYNRPLIFDNNRIFELYKLDDTSILEAMVGINSLVPEWQASNLEKSAYTQIMRSNYADIDLELIQNAYGYNSISKLVGDTPEKTQLLSGLQTVELSYNLQANITAYEYDADGYLSAYHYQAQGYEYTTPNQNAALIEVISGRGTYQPTVVFGIDNIELPTIDNYRVYMCYLVNGVPNEAWKDITGSELYHVDNNYLIWNNLETDQYLMIRSDDTFLAYDYDLESVNGLLFFTLSELEERFGVVNNYTLPVPLGNLDIFLNNHYLIQNIDYILKFPLVYIISKSHLVQPVYTTVQKLHVRFTGFAKNDLSLDDIEDKGYIQHGFLSNNNRYDLRDDKVLHIAVNGQLKHRDDVLFSEDHTGVSIVNALNGQPYEIKDIVVPLKQLVNENTYSLRAKSMAIDERVANYMTVKLPQPPRDAVSSIPQLYAVISPFIARIISDIVNKIILPNTVQTQITVADIMQVCKPYEYLLDIDPINNGFDLNYVIIHPILADQIINVDIYSYRFIQKVIDIYYKNLTEISSFLSIIDSGV